MKKRVTYSADGGIGQIAMKERVTVQRSWGNRRNSRLAAGYCAA
ncbi:hypothetical protein ACFPVX_08720 [Cohnella faecalis]|nr:hypothetical protein [Cohnella faecalis]